MGIIVHTSVFVLSVFTILALLYQNAQDKQTVQYSYAEYFSSVTCVQSFNGGKSCSFANLIYNAEHGFLFILSNLSVIHGLDGYEDLKTLSLAPIEDHSAPLMKLTVVKINESGIAQCRYVSGDVFAIYRFKPDNIMHVIHDDVLPLFVKYREICFGNVSRCSNTYNLFFVDSNKGGPYRSWYRALSRAEPLLASKMSFNESICFESLMIGVANTYFFQYGFKKPQGPISSNLFKTDVSEFRRYFLKTFGVRSVERKHKIVTLISRSVNRKITNEEYLFRMFSTPAGGVPSKVELRKIDMIRNTTFDILQSVASSTTLIGMHGAETILSIFLPDCSVFVELFPFGISRNHVSPIASLSDASKTHFKYFSWVNTVENNSIVHPEYPREFGGISSFPLELQLEIQNAKSIPAVECCGNPYYLFRMYQDTTVDGSIAEVSKKVSVLLENWDCTGEEDVFSRWLFPSPPRKLMCSLHPSYTYVSWDKPINMVNLPVTYYVSIQIGSKLFHYKTKKLHLKFESAAIKKTQIWLSCHHNGMVSADVYSDCE